MTENIQSFSSMLRRALGDRITADAGTFVEMMAEDGVMEFPYAPAGLPTRLEGRAAIASHLEEAGKMIAFDRMGACRSSVDRSRYRRAGVRGLRARHRDRRAL